MTQIVPKSPDIKAFGALYSFIVLAQGFGTRDRLRCEDAWLWLNRSVLADDCIRGQARALAGQRAARCHNAMPCFMDG